MSTDQNPETEQENPLANRGSSDHGLGRCAGCGSLIADTKGERIPVRGANVLRICDACCSFTARYLTLGHLQGEEKRRAFELLKKDLQAGDGDAE
ncbi:hypothetical protein [Halostagnicola larsenii]|uniref:hypothetical protein n=1 Tax=Halostagnicola larsenii TaxID=353800 RepID=UPI0012F74438|nr:hypothetical protein [Halostagnicola larsenii]